MSKADLTSPDLSNPEVSDPDSSATVNEPMVRPAPDPIKLLAAWNEWENGETPPGRVIANLKIAGMREMLEALAAQAQAAAEAGLY